MAIFPLDKESKTKDITKNNPPGIPSNVRPAPGPDGRPDGSTLFFGSTNSYIEFPNNGQLDTRRSMTILAWVYHNGRSGPIFNYDRRGFGVHLWMVGPRVLFVRFVRRSRRRTSSVATYSSSSLAYFLFLPLLLGACLHAKKWITLPLSLAFKIQTVNTSNTLSMCFYFIAIQRLHSLACLSVCLAFRIL